MGFFKTTLSQQEFSELLQQQNSADPFMVKKINIENMEIPVQKLSNMIFRDIEWKNINAEGKTFSNVRFENCKIENSNFRHIKLLQVEFHNCELINVVFNHAEFDRLVFENSKLSSTDPNIDNNYREMTGQEIHFNHTELTALNFFHGKMKFYVKESKLNDISAYGLKTGSLLSIIDSEAYLINFSRSTFSTLEVKNSNIKKSKAGGCSIDTILLEDSDLEFPIADGIKKNKVIARNTGSIVIGGTPTESVYISDCPKNSRVISVGGDEFEDIFIENCSPDDIKFWRSAGKKIHIKNASVSWLAFTESTIDHLILENVHIENELYYQDTNIKKLETINVTFTEGIEIDKDNSNIEIIPDKILKRAY